MLTRDAVISLINRLETRAIEAGFPKSELYRDAAAGIRHLQSENDALNNRLSACRQFVESSR
jgi:hypothetical protein